MTGVGSTPGGLALFVESEPGGHGDLGAGAGMTGVGSTPGGRALFGADPGATGTVGAMRRRSSDVMAAGLGDCAGLRVPA
ncbi:hypothetical protein ACWEIJ_31925 [Lentzea sp. NPDC004789]